MLLEILFKQVTDVSVERVFLVLDIVDVILSLTLESIEESLLFKFFDTIPDKLVRGEQLVHTKFELVLCFFQ